MSEFFSNFLTYTTVSVFAAGCFVVGQNLTPGEDVARSETMTSLDDLRDVTLFSELDPAAATPLPTVQLEQAVLQSVVFTANGVSDLAIPQADNRPRGTVTGNSVNLREGPGTGFSIAGRAAGGDTLVVTGAREGIWFEVISANTGQPVWIHGNFFNAPPGADGAVLAQN